MTLHYQDKWITIHHGDCREVIKGLADCSVGSVVTDPPYELGFMGKGWDKSGIAYNVEVWRECLRVLKPGGHLLAFGGSRTYHRLACAIEDAGFEIRDQIQWIYGSGFPKSLDVSKAIDAAAGVEREVVGKRTDGRYASGFSEQAKRAMGDLVHAETQGFKGELGIITNPATDAAKQWNGWGTALKPAHEPIVVARKPLIGTVAENVLQHGTGGLNIDGCRIATVENLNGGAHAQNGSERHDGAENWRYKIGGAGEFVQPEGRWPANVIHDGSDEVLTGFPDVASGSGNKSPRNGYSGIFKGVGQSPNPSIGGDSGSAARFFYCAKASKEDREEGLELLSVHSAGKVTDRKDGSDGLNSLRAGTGRTGGSRNFHPTVKPTDLMRYLVRLVTPPNGIILDPFCGSGSTGKAAALEQFKSILIDLDIQYCELAANRAPLVQEGFFNQ